MMPPKTPVSIEGMPMISLVSMPLSFAKMPIVGQEDDPTHRAGECGHTVVFREANGDADGEEQGQVAEDRAAGPPP